MKIYESNLGVGMLKKLTVFIFIFSLSLATLAMAQSGQLDTWYLRETTLDGWHLSRVEYGNGIFLAAGAKGFFEGAPALLYRSEDGVNWTEVLISAPRNQGLLFVNGMFVSAWADGKIRTSLNGTTWTTRFTKTDGTGFAGVTHGNGTFVVLGGEWGNTCASYSSEDGISWKKNSFTCGPPTAEQNDIVFGNGIFVTVGDYGRVFTSPDGVEWTERYPGLPQEYGSMLTSVAYGNGVFLAAAWMGDPVRWLKSTDGVFWDIYTGSLPGTDIRASVFNFANGLFFSTGLGHQETATSADGVMWSPINFPGYQLEGIAYGKRTFVAVDFNYSGSTEFGVIYQSAVDTSPVTLSVEKTGTGVGSVSSIPSGIECGSVCSYEFAYGSVVTITAQADIDSTFTGWSGACSGTNPVCVLTMDDDLSVTATFYRPPQPSVNEGTIGTQITITGSGFGDKKGKVLIGGLKQKIDSWTPASISVTVNKVPLPAEIAYDVLIQPKGTLEIPLFGAFTVKPPEIDSLDSYEAAPGTSITITGNFFSTKKGKVYLGDQVSGKRKNCKITSWGMDSITFVVPKTSKSFPAGTYFLDVVNKIGVAEASSEFTID